MFAELKHTLAGDQVADAVAVLGAGDHAGVVEDRQVFGDVLLAGAGRLLELDDGEVAFAQVVEQLDPHRLGKDAEALGDQADEPVKRAGAE